VPAFRSRNAADMSFEKSQHLAHRNFTVVVAWFSKNTKDTGIHTVILTVRPCEPYSNKNGPVLANVGGEVGNFSVLTVFKSEKNKSEVKFYYDPGQSFVFDTRKMYLKR
jgi:hypothetical protein